MKPVRLLFVALALCSCSSQTFRFPEDLIQVSAESYTLAIEEASGEARPSGKLGPFDAVVTQIDLLVHSDMRVEFPQFVFEDLGWLHAETAELKMSPSEGIQVLSLGGGDGGESYGVHFGIRDSSVIWRRLGWICQNSEGHYLETCTDDSFYE